VFCTLNDCTIYEIINTISKSVRIGRIGYIQRYQSELINLKLSIKQLTPFPSCCLCHLLRAIRCVSHPNVSFHRSRPMAADAALPSTSSMIQASDAWSVQSTSASPSMGPRRSVALPCSLHTYHFTPSQRHPRIIPDCSYALSFFRDHLPWCLYYIGIRQDQYGIASVFLNTD